MKVTLNRTEFMQELQTVQRAISSKLPYRSLQVLN